MVGMFEHIKDQAKWNCDDMDCIRLLVDETDNFDSIATVIKDDGGMAPQDNYNILECWAASVLSEALKAGLTGANIKKMAGAVSATEESTS